MSNYPTQEADNTKGKEKDCTTRKDFLRPLRAEARAVTLESLPRQLRSMNLFRCCLQFCSSISERQVDKARVVLTRGSLPGVRSNPTNR